MYQFSMASLMIGLVIMLAGGATVVYHQKMADILGSGVSSYDRFRLWGLIICGVGLVVAFSLHSVVLNFLLARLFGL